MLRRLGGAGYIDEIRAHLGGQRLYKGAAGLSSHIRRLVMLTGGAEARAEEDVITATNGSDWSRHFAV